MEEDTTKTERSGKKPKKRAPRDPAGRRQAIIDAAANLIAREGSSKITNRRVAEEAGVRTSSGCTPTPPSMLRRSRIPRWRT